MFFFRPHAALLQLLSQAAAGFDDETWGPVDDELPGATVVTFQTVWSLVWILIATLVALIASVVFRYQEQKKVRGDFRVPLMGRYSKSSSGAYNIISNNGSGSISGSVSGARVTGRRPSGGTKPYE